MRRIATSLLLTMMAVTLLIGSACTERNPDYDPNYVPPCDNGTARCSEDERAIELCRDGEFHIFRECWNGTSCDDAHCVPDDGVPFCKIPDDCGNGLVCTAVVFSEQQAVGNSCIPAPHPDGREAGQSCAKGEDCKSGWCFKSVCYQPCLTDDDCPDSMNCAELSVTIDSVRGVLKGCTGH